MYLNPLFSKCGQVYNRGKESFDEDGAGSVDSYGWRAVKLSRRDLANCFRNS